MDVWFGFIASTSLFYTLITKNSFVISLLVKISLWFSLLVKFFIISFFRSLYYKKFLANESNTISFSRIRNNAKRIFTLDSIWFCLKKYNLKKSLGKSWCTLVYQRQGMRARNERLFKFLFSDLKFGNKKRKLQFFFSNLKTW